MLKKYLIISTTTDLVRIAPEKIVFISSDGNYCNLVQADNETRMLTFQLGQVENMIREQLGTEQLIINNIKRLSGQLIASFCVQISTIGFQ